MNDLGCYHSTSKLSLRFPLRKREQLHCPPYCPVCFPRGDRCDSNLKCSKEVGVIPGWLSQQSMRLLVSGL